MKNSCSPQKGNKVMAAPFPRYYYRLRSAWNAHLPRFSHDPMVISHDQVQKCKVKNPLFLSKRPVKWEGSRKGWRQGRINQCTCTAKRRSEHLCCCFCRWSDDGVNLRTTFHPSKSRFYFTFRTCIPAQEGSFLTRDSRSLYRGG